MSPLSPTKIYKTFKKSLNINKTDKQHILAHKKALGFNLNFDLGDTGDIDLYFIPTNSVQPTTTTFFKLKLKNILNILQKYFL